MQIIKGTTGLLSSRKGALSLIIVACITYLCATGKMDGMSFAAVIGTVQLIFCWAHSKTDQQSMRNSLGITGGITEDPLKELKNKISQ